MRPPLSVALPLALVAALAACQKTGAPTARIALAPGAHAVGELLVVDAAGSTDAQGKPLEYHWTVAARPAGSRARLSGDTLSRAVLLPDEEGTYAFQLVVGNGVLTASATAEVQVRCGVASPQVVVAPPPASNRVGSPVVLAATVTDADDASPCSLKQTATIAWRFRAMPAGSRSTLSGAQGEKPSFVPDVPGTYTLEATALDSTGRKGTATVDVAVATCGASAPEITELGATPATVGSPVRLSATATDPDAQEACGGSGELTYAWRLAAIPAGSHAALVGPALQTPWFTPDLAGAYVAEVTVTDVTRRSASRRITVDASECGGHAPAITALAASNPAPATGEAVTLTPTVEDADNADACGAKQTFRLAWRVLSLPSGSATHLSDAAAFAPSLLPDVPGTYDIEAIATDSTGRASAPARVTVTASTCGDNAPVADVGPALEANIGGVVQVRGTATDADTNAATCGLAESFAWSWSFVALPAGSHASLAGRETSTPWFVPDVAGEFVLQAMVSDLAGHRSAPARVTITARACGGATPAASVAATNAAPNAGERVNLAATASDADNLAPCSANQALSYAWSFEALPAGSRATLTAATTALATFVPDVPGTYSLKLEVSDGTGHTATVRQDVVAGACGASRPSATVAAPGSLAVGVAASLVPTVTDADNGAACQARTPPTPVQSFTYAWTLLSAPVGSLAALSSPAARAPSLVPDVPGTYLARLVVTDSTGLQSACVDTALSVGTCGASTPAASLAASLATPNLLQTTQFSLTYTDADESAACRALLGTVGPVSYAWRLAGTPPGSRASLLESGGATASLQPDVAGTYTVEAWVTDVTGRAGRAQASIAAGTCGRSTPTAAPALATGQTLRVGAPVMVQANAVDADNLAPCSLGQALGYQWSFAEVPAGARPRFGAATVKDFSFVPDVAGTYVLAVQVADTTGRRSAPASATVTVGTCGGAAPVAQVRMTSPSNVGPSPSLVVNPLLSCLFQLDARDTTDADAACGLAQAAGDLDYRWAQVSAPAGSQGQLSNPSAQNPWFRIDQGGTYDFRLTASDGTYTSAPATARIVHKGFSIASVSPAVSCQGATPATLVLTAGGQGFLRLNATNTLPTVTMTPGSTVQSVSGCAPSGITGVDACTTLTLQIPAGLFVGNYTITVRNPVQDGCAAQAFYSIGPPPTVSSVSPTQVCGADDPLQPDQFSLNVRGSNFLRATQLSLGSSLALSTTLNSSSNMDGVFNIPTPGTYSVSASNGSVCGSTLSNAVTVLAVPLVFFVDPPVVYNGISTQATAYISGLNGSTITAVRIRPAGTTGPLTSLTYTYDLARANQAKLVLPAGLAPGSYEILVTDGATCTSIPVSAIKVTGSLTLALSRIDPPFGATNQNTSVDLRATQPAPTGQEGFLSTPPRVYLNPTGSGAGVARALNAVTVVSSELANAVVKAGIPAGTYDVIVVNSDGAVGLLTAAYMAVTSPPPVIDSITPGSIPSGTVATVLVRGQNFSSPSFRWDCVDATGTATSYTATVTSATATSLLAAPPPGVTVGTVCVGVAKNADGTYGEYSALGVTSPAENLGAFVANSPMLVARRAPAVTSARPTRSARFLYAFGGDSGSIAGAYQSAEVAPLDRFGNLGAWRALPLDLPAPTTLGQAVTVGRYVYLAGGNASGAVTNKAARALVLDPNAPPDITDLFLQFKAGALGAGTWYYRVAAVMSGSDADNPGGEALPSDPLTVQIPAGLPNTLSGTLTWSAVPGAAGYRIYRSPAANAAAGAEQLIGTVSAPSTSFLDDGKTVVAGVPRKIGDLGVWVSLPNLNVARQGAGITAARDPSNANLYYLYLAGGFTPASTVDGTYEYLTLQVNPTTGQQQAATSWIRDTSNTITGRTQLALFNVTDLVTTRVSANETWLHAGPGLGAGGAAVSSVDAARVQAGGLLTAWAGEKALNNRAGYAYAAAANQLFVFGGQGAAPGVGGISAQLCGAGGPCAGPPGLQNWNAGISLGVARYLPGSVVESAHIFAIGGQSSSGPTSTVESVIW